MSRSVLVAARAVGVIVSCIALVGACFFPPPVDPPPPTPAALSATATNGAASCGASLCTATVSITVSNTGTTSTVGTPSVSGASGNGLVEVGTGTCVGPLAGTSSCTFTLTLTTSATGAAHTFTGTGSVVADGTLTASAPFTITANPTPAELTVIVTPSNTFTCPTASFCSSFLNVIVTNTGGSATSVKPTFSVTNALPTGSLATPVQDGCLGPLARGGTCLYGLSVSLEPATGPVTFTGAVTATDGVVTSTPFPYSVTVGAFVGP